MPTARGSARFNLYHTQAYFQKNELVEDWKLRFARFGVSKTGLN